MRNILTYPIEREQVVIVYTESWSDSLSVIEFKTYAEALRFAEVCDLECVIIDATKEEE